ncbi:hypothetical protein ACROYT_G013234 [Oculina patagonica]
MKTSFIQEELRVRCCQDAYPGHLISKWDEWQEEHESSNKRPDIFPQHQFFIIIDNSNGGQSLEYFDLKSMAEAWTVLEQTAVGLAVAENAMEFEHRHLHWGTLLISRTQEKFITSTLLGEEKVVESNGVRVAIIDFTWIKKGF